MNIINRRTGLEVTGTLETLSARAHFNSVKRNEDGSFVFDWSGGSDVFWDEQRTVERDGSPVFLDEEGNECVFDDLVFE